MVEVVLHNAEAGPFNFPNPWRQVMPVQAARETISSAEAVPMVTAEALPVILRVTGETSHSRRLSSKINNLKWGTLVRGSSSKVDSSQVIAIVHR